MIHVLAVQVLSNHLFPCWSCPYSECRLSVDAALEALHFRIGQVEMLQLQHPECQ